MNDEKKIGFSVELENNRVDLWANGDDETLVNLAVAATANIVAAACGNDVKEAEKLLQDVKIGLDAALDVPHGKRDAGDPLAHGCLHRAAGLGYPEQSI